MTNEIQIGNRITVALAADASGGDPVLVGDTVVVLANGGEVGDVVIARYDGVFRLPKAAGVGTGVAQGKKVYLDPATGLITGTAGALKQAGIAFSACADADVTIDVRLLG